MFKNINDVLILGEANAGMLNYHCTFPAMINDWRLKFTTATHGQVDAQFPFGFVQVRALDDCSLISIFMCLDR